MADRPVRTVVCRGRRVTAARSLWLFGGVTNFNADAAMNDLWVSRDDGATWMGVTLEPMSDLPQPRGLIYDLAVWKGDLWLCGGGNYTDTVPRTYFNDVWRFEITDDSAAGVSGRWISIPQGPGLRWTAREYHNVAVFDDKLWVMSGWGPAYDDAGNRTVDAEGQSMDSNHDDVWFTEDGSNWQRLEADSIWPPGHADGVCVDARGLWHITGNGTFADGNVDVWLLTQQFVEVP